MKKVELVESQKISIEILKVISEICKENELRYCLMYGTLIGAIRHKGFIPWDDDIDIMMPRPDYEELLKYMKINQALYPHLEVFNPNTKKDYPYMITRISDNRYIIDTENEKDCGMGVFIDIYPFDGLGNSKEEALSFGLKGDRWSSLCYLATRENYRWEELSSPIKNIIKLPLFILAKCIGKDVLQNRLQKLANVKKYDENEFVGCIVWLSGGWKDIFKKSWFDELIQVPYEGEIFCVPKEYDVVLSHIYGDYMKLPPVEEQIGHHFYTVYKK